MLIKLLASCVTSGTRAYCRFLGENVFEDTPDDASNSLGAQPTVTGTLLTDFLSTIVRSL